MIGSPPASVSRMTNDTRRSSTSTQLLLWIPTAALHAILPLLLLISFCCLSSILGWLDFTYFCLAFRPQRSTVELAAVRLRHRLHLRDSDQSYPDTTHRPESPPQTIYHSIQDDTTHPQAIIAFLPWFLPSGEAGISTICVTRSCTWTSCNSHGTVSQIPSVQGLLTWFFSREPGRRADLHLRPGRPSSPVYIHHDRPRPPRFPYH